MLKNNRVANADSEHFSDKISPALSKQPISLDAIQQRPTNIPNLVLSSSPHLKQSPNQCSGLDLKGNEEIKIEKKTTKATIKKEKIRRVEQNIFWYLFTIISTILLGTQNIYIYFWDYNQKDLAILFPSLLVRILLFIFSTYHLTHNLKVALKLYFSFDKVLLTTVAFSIGVVGFQIVYLPLSIHPWVQYVLCVMYPLAIFLHAGHFRIVLVHVEWSKCQTIMMKIALLIGGSSCFGLSIYYTILGVDFVEEGDEKMQEMLRNFIFLFAFAGFDFYLESFSLMDDIDGTTKCKNIYRLQCSEESLETLLKSSEKRKKLGERKEVEENLKKERHLMKVRKIESYFENEECS